MKRSIMAVAGLAALVGCSDVEGPDVEGAPSFSPPREEALLASQRSRAPQATANTAARSWFDIEFAVDGALKPETPIKLTITYTANFATTGADLRVTLPEVEYAELSEWGQAYKTPVGIQVPAKLESNREFSAGGQVEQVTHFSMRAPGIYRVHASAESEQSKPDDFTGRAQPTTHETVWLLVGETGGRILDDFDPDVVPAGFHRQPGPFRKVDPGEPKPSEAGFGFLMRPIIEFAAGLFGKNSCGSDEVCITFVYYDNDLKASHALRDLRYEWKFVNVPDGYEVESGSGVTDSQGKMTAACPDFSIEGAGTVSFDDAKAKIIPNTDNDFRWGHGDCGEELEITLPSREGRTWVNAWHTIRNSEQKFVTRRKMRIQVNPPGETACGYLPAPDVIRVIQNDIWRCIWGSYGLFVLPHEYGHALHEKSLGGVAQIDSTCWVHRPDTWEKLGCAYNEGWADYYAYEVRPTVFGDNIPRQAVYADTMFEQNEYYVTGHDGAHYSGIIMAFFWDLFDDTSESHDSLELDQTVVTKMMGGCEIREGTEWIHPTGIDHLIWCLEAAVDTAVTGGTDYFSTRSPDPTDQNQSDHHWNEDHIRTLWLKNLYNVDG
jgi:hypothetical protein